jgi:hypothetical protein
VSLQAVAGFGGFRRDSVCGTKPILIRTAIKETDGDPGRLVCRAQLLGHAGAALHRASSLSPPEPILWQQQWDPPQRLVSHESAGSCRKTRDPNGARRARASKTVAFHVTARQRNGQTALLGNVAVAPLPVGSIALELETMNTSPTGVFGFFYGAICSKVPEFPWLQINEMHYQENLFCSILYRRCRPCHHSLHHTSARANRRETLDITERKKAEEETKRLRLPSGTRIAWPIPGKSQHRWRTS